MKPLASLSSFRRRGFTLLEVVLGVMILGLTSVGIFKFVQSTLQAIRLSVEDAEEVLSVERLAALVQEELFNLPIRGNNGSLTGIQTASQGRDFDTLEWPSRGGAGLMTTAATGEYRVRLMMKPT